MHFKEIGEKYGPFDLAFIENGQYHEKWKEIHMLPEETIKAFYDLKAKQLFPIHWGMFKLGLHKWDDPIHRISKLCLEHNISQVSPKLGEIFHLNN